MTTIHDDDWQRIQQLFDEALSQPESARAAFIEQTVDDPQLRSEVEQLLAAYCEGEDELESSPFGEPLSHPDNGTGTSQSPESLPGYRVLNEIHRGGQGIVYRAIQESTKREVALKFIRTDASTDGMNKKRFEREVELAGGLRHPGIVRIFDSGLANGQYYYVMDYLEGDRLDVFTARHDLSHRQILELFLPICEAVSHAHRRGVIHRDLKPSNIIVDAQGAPHLIDFGLAKLDDFNTETPQLSLTGQVMGTVSYMSPEQASGRPDAIDTRSDIYSLAVVLYELLCRRLPYDLGASLATDLVTIQTVDPRAMRGVDRDVETIIFKALSKDPDRRYQSAAEFRDDIDCFLRGETISARRDSVLYVIQKAVKRHRLASAALAAFAFSVIASSVVGWGLYVDAEQARHEEGIASENYQRERDTAQRLRDESQQRRYFVEMDLAGRLLSDSGGSARIEEIVERWQSEPDLPAQLRGWEWHYLASRIDRHVAELQLDEVPNCARFSPDGRLIAFGDNSGLVQICSGGDLSKVTRVGRHENVVLAVDWSSDGHLLASGSVDHQVFIYDMSSNTRIEAYSHEDHVTSVEWHPSQNRLASASVDGVVKIWNGQTGELEHELRVGVGAQSLDWTNDGRQLAIGLWSRKVRIWDLQTASFARDLTGYSAVPGAVSWSGDGGLIATGEDNGGLTVRNSRKPAQRWNFDNQRQILDLKWSPDSTSLAVVGYDRAIKIWEPSLKTMLRKIDGHRETIWSVDWSPDGQRLLTCAHDYTLKLWLADDPEDDRILHVPGSEPVHDLAWSPDDSQIATASAAKSALVFDVRTRDIVQELDQGDWIRQDSVSWSPDGSKIAAGGWGENVMIWDAQTGKPLSVLDHQSRNADSPIPNVVNSIAWSPDGRRLATSCYESAIRVWDAADGSLTQEYSVGTGNVHSVDWHPTEPDRIAASTSIHGALIWPLSQQRGQPIETDKHQARCIRWSPDGTRIAVCRDDGLVTIHDGKTYDLLLSLRNHQGQVLNVDWHPHGNRLASASEDGTVRVWDATTGIQVMSFESLNGPAHCVAWSHSGNALAAGGRAGIVHIFDATSGYQRQAAQGAARGGSE